MVYFEGHIVFNVTGQDNAKRPTQLANFAEQLRRYFPEIQSIWAPVSWQEAFQLLRTVFDAVKGNKKKVLFFDELPWLDSHKSGFLSAFSYFWNDYASRRTDVLVVICGSAASWIIDKVVDRFDRGCSVFDRGRSSFLQ